MAEVEEKQAKPKHDETPLEAFASICGVLAVGLFVLTFVFQNFAIPSSSMVGALLVGDHVLVDRITLAPPAAYAPFVHYRNVRHGDIIVFYKPTLEANGEHLFLVKRVMGLPGDRIHLRAGIVYRNGVALDEPYAAKPTDMDYNAYRDDFPSVSGVEQRRCHCGMGRGAAHLYSGPGSGRTPRHVLRHGRQPHRQPRQPLLGIRAARQHRRPPPLRLLVLRYAGNRRSIKTSLADRVGWILHETIHFFDGTRWRRTLHRVQ